MMIEGWDIPISPSEVYDCRWAEILGTKPYTRRQSLADNIETAKRLCQIHGAIPGVCWLQKNGYYSLYEAIKKYPEYFVDFPRISNPHPSLQERVLAAEKLAEENGGILPNPNWLQTHGYWGLNKSIRNHPEAYSHIIQDRKFKTVTEWVSIAEGLAVEHDGLPGCRWLERNNLYGLYKCMTKHPDSFSHIPRQEARDAI